MGRGPSAINDQYRVPKPKSLKEVPAYIDTLTKTFFERLFYIFKLVWNARKTLLFAMIFMALFNGVMPVIGSLIAANILNKLALAYSGELLTFGVISVLLIWQFSYLFFNSAMTYIYSMITSVSGELVTNHVRLRIMEKAKTVDLASYDSPEFYAKMENANREAGTRPIEIMKSTFSVLGTLISMIGYVIILFGVNRTAPLVIILVSIPATIVNFIYRKKNVNYRYKKSKNRRQMDYYANILINKDLVKEIRMFGLADTFCEKYQEVFTQYYKGLKQLKLGETIWNILSVVVSNVVFLFLYVFFAKGVFAGTFEVGNYSLYTGAITAFGSGVSSLITTVASIYEGTLFTNNLISFMNEKPSIVPATQDPRSVERHTGHTIVFENVSFRYPGTQKDVIKHINLKIDQGDTVVIVGLNGAGKTTLIKLLTRLYDPTEGRILLDGHDLKEYSVEELYAMFGIIFQDFGKYAFSAKENIQFGDIHRQAEQDAVCCAAQQSGADSFIKNMPNGYDTPLMRYFESNGVEPSIGQWQKLAIARAFYSDSDIIILDEPTASLDPIAEQEIFNQFDELRKDKTTIFVSHRLSSATLADKIVVLENGEIIEIGNHCRLMKKNGRYCELFSAQASRYQPTA